MARDNKTGNFFSKQLAKVGKTQFTMAVELELRSATTVSAWCLERVVPGVPIAKLAAAFGVTEKKMAEEVMALRMRIEARDLAKSKASSFTSKQSV